MKIHRQLMFLVGLGMVLILMITVLSLQYVTDRFSHTTREITRISGEAQKIWVIEREIDEINRAVQNYVITGDQYHVRMYETAQQSLDKILQKVSVQDQSLNESSILATLTQDLDRMKKKAERIFSLDASGKQRMLAANLLTELNGLHIWMERDIVKYQEMNAAETTSILRQLHRNNLYVNIVFLLILLTSLTALAVFVLYFRRKVTIPLNDLWEGTEEISRGNLDFQVQVKDGSDISRLGERFNEMAERLRASYSELEQKLYERTHELASLDAVALTLSQAGTLKDMLDKSLLKVLDSLSGIDPKGGVFLCEPGGETLRLMSHKGLPPQFVKQESVIRMGECLCGIVAQTGELLYTEHGRQDARHSRPNPHCHSHIIIPIKSRGIVLGVIFLYPQKDFLLKPSDVQMLEAIGVQLGMAVENFRFYAEVKESSEKYWDLFENATDILFTMDASGRLTAVNKAAETFSGYSKIELFGKNVLDFLTPESVDRGRKLFERGFTGRQWTEFEVAKADGSSAFLEVSVRRLYSNRRPAGYQVSARDVTEQKRLREMLVQAERLGAIGQVSVAVRHEINNPLTTVIGNTELLLERYEGKDRELETRLETVLNNALRIAEIVKQLQSIKKDKVVEYLKGVKMTDLKQK